jgi:hypothetical protein
MISLSSDKKQISQMLTSIVRAAEAGESAAPHQKNYTNGIKTVISTLEESLKIAAIGAQMKNLSSDIAH